MAAVPIYYPASYPFVPTPANPYTCVICINNIGLDERVYRLGCNHIFHQVCLEPWFRGANTCPQCRADPYGNPQNLWFSELLSRFGLSCDMLLILLIECVCFFAIGYFSGIL